jgi:hypothetical protein
MEALALVLRGGSRENMHENKDVIAAMNNLVEFSTRVRMAALKVCAMLYRGDEDGARVKIVLCMCLCFVFVFVRV